MMRYLIEVEETLSRVFDIEADDFEDAFKKANIMYTEGELILDRDDFIGYEINVDEYRRSSRHDER